MTRHNYRILVLKQQLHMVSPPVAPYNAVLYTTELLYSLLFIVPEMILICNEEKRIKYEVYDFIIEHVKQEKSQFAEEKKRF